jgi:hypothetical protein
MEVLKQGSIKMSFMNIEALSNSIDFNVSCCVV